MKGIILSGGSGTRLRPMTRIINKSLLPVYDKPIIYYPIQTLKQLGCEEIMIISGSEHCGQIMSQLGSGADYDVSLTYRVQERAGGIAQALGICRNFAGNDPIAVCLGDNIFQDKFSSDLYSGEGAHIFLKSVPDPERFGVAEVVGTSVVGIEEKPRMPKSDLCVTGLYIYDNYVWNIIKNLSPSDRGELEITDVNNWYVKNGLMKYEVIDGFWSDAGTPDSLIRASQLIKDFPSPN